MTHWAHEPEPEWPAWVRRLFPTGIPASDPLAWETPASDAQVRYLSVLGVRDRWVNREEASALITRLKREHAKAARLAARKGATA